MKHLICIALCILLILTSGCSAPAEAPMVQHTQPTAAPSPVPAAPQQTHHGAQAEFSIALPEGWTVADALALEGMTERDEDGTVISVTEFSAQNERTGESIVILYENLARSEETRGITAQEYAKIVTEGLKESGEFPYSVGKAETLSLCGQEYLALHCVVEGYDFEQLYLMRREGDRMAVIILSGENTDNLRQFFAE